MSKKRPRKTNTITPLRFSKTDTRYWAKRVFKNTYSEKGVQLEAAHYSIKIQCAGQRETFPLHTGNKSLAGEKARDIYITLLANGWEQCLAEYKPNKHFEKELRPTLGEFICEVREIYTGREVTLNAYIKALRRIVSDIFEINSKGKYNVRGGGSEEWQKQVDQIKLDEVTPSMVRNWQARFVRSRGEDNASKRSGRVTVNTLLRNAKALFSKRLLIALEDRLELPEQLPFSMIVMEPMPSMRYVGKIDAQELLEAASKELGQAPSPEEKEKEIWERHQRFKIFLLALRFGLRKSEIDALQWDSFDFGKKLLSIHHTEHHTLKSEDSAGELELDADMVAVFSHYSDLARGKFVIESTTVPRSLNISRTYRANHHFNELIKWLRSHDVKAKKPIHELRKEFGALVCRKQGIYMASRALRHSDISITAKHYLDRKEPISTGLTLNLQFTEAKYNAA